MEVGFLVWVVWRKIDLKGKQKKIKFQYFEVCTLKEGNPKEELYDLLIWIEKMVELDYEKRKKEIGGIEGRLEDIRVINDEIYALNFMRLDVVSDSYKVKTNKKAEHIDLADDEYIGKNTVVLYDPGLHILMVQCNRGSYNVPAMESYINVTNDEISYIRPVKHDLNIDQCLNEKVLKLDVRFSDIRQFRPQKSDAFEKVIESCNDWECVTAHLELGLGYTKIESMNNDTIYCALEDIKANTENVSSAKIILDDDKKATVYDLLDNFEDDYITFTVPERGELGFEFMSDKMYEVYTGGARARIVSHRE